MAPAERTRRAELSAGASEDLFFRADSVSAPGWAFGDSEADRCKARSFFMFFHPGGKKVKKDHFRESHVVHFLLKRVIEVIETASGRPPPFYFDRSRRSEGIFLEFSCWDPEAKDHSLIDPVEAAPPRWSGTAARGSGRGGTGWLGPWRSRLARVGSARCGETEPVRCRSIPWRSRRLWKPCGACPLCWTGT